MPDPPIAPPMPSHARVKEIFAEIADLPIDERARRLAELCGTDEELRRDVESLLGHDAAPRLHVPNLDSLHDAVAEAAESLRSALAAPERVGGYRIIGVLGEGGMGVVYLAEQESPRRTVALKLMRPGFASRQIVRRFRREAEVLGRLQHPNIAAIHEAGSTEVQTPQGPQQIPYFAMEYVEGRILTEHCRERNLDVRARADLLAKVADAVEHAHGRGVVHRDLKPGNILVDARGEPKILDFGIARREGPEQAATTMRTEVGQVVGTLPYMSPEQVSGRPDAVDRRSDVYALGVVLYELLSGRLPLDMTRCTVPEAVRMVSEQDPAPLSSIDRSLRGDLETIVAKCLEKDAGRRYQTAGEFAADLRRYLDDRPIEARPASRMYMLTKFARRNRPLVAGVVVAFLTLLAATAVSVSLAISAHAARLRSDDAARVAQLEARRSTESYAFLAGMIEAAKPSTTDGHDMTVREMLDNARTELLARTGDEPHVTAMLMRVVGFTYERIGRLEDASEILARSVELFRSSAGPGDSHFFAALQYYGYVLHLQGRLPEADAILSEAAALSEHPNIGQLGRAAVLNNLGLLAEELGDHQRAVVMYEESIALRRKALSGGEDADLGILHINMGSSLITLGRFEEAERWIREGMRITDVSEGPRGPYSLTARNNLAVALRGQGRYDEATALIREVFEWRLKVQGPDGHHVAASRGGLANCLLLAGDVNGALPLLEETVVRRMKILGPGSADTGTAHLYLGQGLRQLGRFEEARAALGSGLATYQSALGPTHAKTIEARIAIAQLELDESRAMEALAQADAVLAEAPADLSPALRVAALSVRSTALLELGRPDEALAAVERAKAIAEGGMARTHPEHFALQRLRAEALRSLGRHEDAKAAAEQAIDGLRRALPSGPWRAAEAQATLARVLRDMANMSGGGDAGDTAAADALQAQAVATIDAAIGERSPAGARARRR